MTKKINPQSLEIWLSGEEHSYRGPKFSVQNPSHLQQTQNLWSPRAPALNMHIHPPHTVKKISLIRNWHLRYEGMQKLDGQCSAINLEQGSNNLRARECWWEGRQLRPAGVSQQSGGDSLQRSTRMCRSSPEWVTVGAGWIILLYVPNRMTIYLPRLGG